MRIPHVRKLLQDDMNPNASHVPPRVPYMGDTNFDTNMVIILAALLCALICALGLNSIVRCALRCGRRASIEADTDTATRLSGLKKRALRQIPVSIYGHGGDTPGSDCAICLGEFAEGEKVRILPACRHGFHVRCIDTWLASHASCPTCRGSVVGKTSGNVPLPEIVRSLENRAGSEVPAVAP
ncbi:hypothetical protein AMTR_s00077p00074350 [Amborella trichopoda]|uniref:RING-type domain-containing protein n=1 Tax=Amborella trichopoda TaxID=13333 RepID=W1P965_AMBTC|nr:hypothetical protein AMTR_s00077p00074350 [Amborella trichopoda]